MGRFTEKQLTIMTIVVAVVITGVFAALIYRDLATVDEEEQRIETAKANIQAADVEIDKKKSREEDVIVFREIVNRDASVLPDESEINEFINIIGEYEKSTGVLVTQVTGLSAKGRKKSKEAILRIPLRLKVRGSLDQFLNFINKFENHNRFVRISGFTISRGGGRSTSGEAIHDIQLQLETYQYNDKRGGPIARVEIPNYERKKQALSIQKRIRQSKKAPIETYQMKQRISRRDPLVDPRVAPQPVDEAGEKTQAQVFTDEKALLDHLELEVTLLKDDVRVEKKLHEEHDFMRIAAVSRAIDQRIAQLDYDIAEVLSNREITIPELKDGFNELVVRPYEEVKEERKDVQGEGGNVLVDRRQVFDTLQKMHNKFTEHVYKDVITLYEGFLRFSEGRRLAPDAELLRAEMDDLAQQAEIITKFENEPLKIEGTIIDDKRASFAIINGQIVSEGEFVDQDRRIQIKEIQADQIHFIYEEVPIIKYLR